MVQRADQRVRRAFQQQLLGVPDRVRVVELQQPRQHLRWRDSAHRRRERRAQHCRRWEQQPLVSDPSRRVCLEPARGCVADHIDATDSSGVCRMSAYVGGITREGPSFVPDTSEWQQCPDGAWELQQGASVDTRDFVGGSGSLPLTLNAENAAGVQSNYGPEQINVDNDPVGVSFSTPSDPNPGAWVGHAVTVDASASAGPSGVGGMTCSPDRGAASAYTAAGVAVNGDGVHTLSCTAWNRAVDPQGQPNTATNSMAVHIDEAPPSISFEPQSPSDPTGLVVDTSDSESGVAGGSLQIAPAGSSAWSSVPTSFDGAHLLGHFDDAGLRGPYVIRATSCDNVGNCASTTETLTMPLRLAAASDVGFARIGSPAKGRAQARAGRFPLQARAPPRPDRQGQDWRPLSAHPPGNTRQHAMRTQAREDGATALARDLRCRQLGLHVVTSTASRTASRSRYTGCSSPPRASRSRVSQSRSSRHPTTASINLPRWPAPPPTALAVERDPAARSVTDHPRRVRRIRHTAARRRSGHRDRPGADHADRQSA